MEQPQGETRAAVRQTAQAGMQRTRDFLSERKLDVASGLGGVAEALREMARKLADRKQPDVSHIADRAAEKLDSFSTQLRDADVGQYVDRTQAFARRQPAVFAAGAAAAALILLRLLRGPRDPGSGKA